MISVDDHVVEPPHLCDTWLPAGLRTRGPRMVETPTGAPSGATRRAIGG